MCVEGNGPRPSNLHETMLLNSPETFYAPAEAVALAAELTAEDLDGWTYVAANPAGDLGPFSKIAVYDEDGEFVRNF